MAERTVIKYFTIFMVFMRLASRFYSQWQAAIQAGSPGGDKVTAEEWAEIGMGIGTELQAAIPELEVFVFMKPKG